MLMTKRQEGQRLILALHEKRLDAAVAVDFKEQVVQDVDSIGTDVVIDLTDVEFIDSSGLGALVAVLKHVSGKGRLVLTGLRTKTEQIFKLTRMDTVFEIYPSIDEALEAA